MGRSQTWQLAVLIGMRTSTAHRLRRLGWSAPATGMPVVELSRGSRAGKSGGGVGFGSQAIHGARVLRDTRHWANQDVSATVFVGYLLVCVCVFVYVFVCLCLCVNVVCLSWRL